MRIKAIRAAKALELGLMFVGVKGNEKRSVNMKVQLMQMRSL